LQLTDTNTTNVDSDGFPEGGSRVFQWGWNPVGGAREDALGLTPNDLIANGQIGIVTVTTN
jgi:hypothetical protein